MYVPKKSRARKGAPAAAPIIGDLKLAYGLREAAALISVSYPHIRNEIARGKPVARGNATNLARASTRP